MAPNTLSACKWYLNMGADVIRGKHFENSLQVTLEHGRRKVSGLYCKGMFGVESPEDMTVPEAIEWLDGIQRHWSEYGSQIGNMIDGLRRYEHKEQ